eukprot:NODE_4172_length_832_cov_8.435504_g3449_i0.p6 GENE.NODE_4172_length_832_cov_8.435504_g3449_i0~~NODE_4172_length_832_cov_8.435504_g3449_i0.p6  ORF type:complete len:58 (-),score=9.76 NODE_4172_length_832_cov_8.435504_g3449_i0:121-294(-)
MLKKTRYLISVQPLLFTAERGVAACSFQPLAEAAGEEEGSRIQEGVVASCCLVDLSR